jgi:hypothetical protein
MTRDQEDDPPDEKSSRANGVFDPFQDVYPKLYLESKYKLSDVFSSSLFFMWCVRPRHGIVLGDRANAVARLHEGNRSPKKKDKQNPEKLRVFIFFGDSYSISNEFPLVWVVRS